MRNYRHFDTFLSELTGDVYAQPPDPFHLAWGTAAIKVFLGIVQEVHNVLDVGCGQAVFAPLFQSIGIDWTGVTLGQDFEEARKVNGNVHHADMTFLPFDSNLFETVFCRHAIEHSPFPVITLMEFRRVCNGHLMLVVPASDFWMSRGRNHYSVLAKDHWSWLLERSGWHTIHENTFTTKDPVFVNANARGAITASEPSKDVEYWFLCEAAERVTE